MEHETKASSSGGRHGSHKHNKKKRMPLALKIILLVVLALLLAGAGSPEKTSKLWTSKEEKEK